VYPTFPLLKKGFTDIKHYKYNTAEPNSLFNQTLKKVAIWGNRKPLNLSLP